MSQRAEPRPAPRSSPLNREIVPPSGLGACLEYSSVHLPDSLAGGTVFLLLTKAKSRKFRRVDSPLGRGSEG